MSRCSICYKFAPSRKLRVVEFESARCSIQQAMATDDEDSPASSTYGNDDESSDDMLDGGSDEEESEDGDEVEGDDADDDSGAEGQLELITDNGAFLNNHSGLRDTRPGNLSDVVMI